MNNSPYLYMKPYKHHTHTMRNNSIFLYRELLPHLHSSIIIGTCTLKCQIPPIIDTANCQTQFSFPPPAAYYIETTYNQFNYRIHIANM